MHKPLVGIVTVLYESSPVLPDFVASMRQQTYRDYIVIAIDNASKDNGADLLEAEGPPFFVSRNKINVGFAAATNQGILSALEQGCDLILELNNDIVLEKKALELLVEGLEKYNCDATTPMMYYHDQPNLIWAAGGRFQSWFAQRAVHNGLGQRDTGQYNLPQAVAHAPGCCVLFRRNLFAEIGLLDERSFVYSDDNDFSYRLQIAGKKIFYVPEAKLWHKVSSLTGVDSPFSMRYMARGRAYFIAKHLGQSATLLWTLLYRAYFLLRFLLRKDSRAALSIKQKGWSEGLRVANENIAIHQ